MEEGEMSDGAHSSASSKAASRDGSTHKPIEKKNAEKSKSRSASSSRSRSSSSRSSHSHRKRSASKSRSRSGDHRRSHRHHKRGHRRSRSRSRSRGHRQDSRRQRRNHDSRSRSRSGRPSRRQHESGGRDGYRGSYRRDASRSPLSSRRRHVGDRDNPVESRCLGVFGLSLYTSERDLTDTFSRYGPIDKVQMVYDYHTGKSRGFAFIYMKHVDDAVEAKENAAGMELDGHKIRVDYSITERAHTPTPGQYLGRSGGGGFTSRRLPYASKRTGHRSMSRSRSPSYSPRRY